MKNLTIFTILLFLLFTACTKENTLSYNGIITGPDYRLCACCGGWFIEIDETNHRFYTLPENSTLELPHETNEFPIKVVLDWRENENACFGDEIIVTEIRRK